MCKVVQIYYIGIGKYKEIFENDFVYIYIVIVSPNEFCQKTHIIYKYVTILRYKNQKYYIRENGTLRVRTYYFFYPENKKHKLVNESTSGYNKINDIYTLASHV